MKIEINALRVQLVRAVVKHVAVPHLLTFGAFTCPERADVMQEVMGICDQIVANMTDDLVETLHRRSETFRDVLTSRMNLSDMQDADRDRLSEVLGEMIDVQALSLAAKETFGCNIAELSAEQTLLLVEVACYGLRYHVTIQSMDLAYSQIVRQYGARYAQSQVQRAFTLVAGPKPNQMYVRREVNTAAQLEQLLQAPGGTPFTEVNSMYVLWMAQPELITDAGTLLTIFDFVIRVADDNLFHSTMKRCNENLNNQNKEQFA